MGMSASSDIIESNAMSHCLAEVSTDVCSVTAAGLHHNVVGLGHGTACGGLSSGYAMQKIDSLPSDLFS